MINRIIAAFLLLLAAETPAMAGSATIGYTPGSGANFAVTTDIGGNYNGRTTICDFSACANGLAVDATSLAAHVVVYQGTAVLSATNGLYSNILQGNIALSASNGIYANMLQGNAAIGPTNGIYANLLQGNAAISATNGIYTNLLQGNAAISAANGLFVVPTTAATWTVTGAVNNATSGVATSSTNLGTVSWNYGFNGTTWDQLQVDGSKSLKVTCITGCSAGSVSNAGSAVATSSTNLGTIGFNYGFNGTTWDQLQVDASKFLKVNCATGCGGTGTISNSGPLAPNSTNTQTVAYLYGYNGTQWVQALADGSGFIQVNTAAGGIQGFPPGTIASGSNLIGIAAGEQHIGEVGTRGGTLTSSALGVTAIPHGNGTCLGTLVTFSNAVRNSAAALTPGTSGTIQNIVVGFASSATPTNLDVIFFTSNPGTNPCATDAANYTLAAGDIGKALPPVPLTAINSSATGYLMSLTNVAIRYGIASGTTLYAALVVRANSVTPALGTTFNIGVFED